MKVIYDKYHGNIEITDFESELLKSPLVNRLHQILQNSTAYLVYPSCKTSRFEHSIGAMNYCSKIFEYGLLNSEVTEKYIDEKTSVLSDVLNEENLFENHIASKKGEASYEKKHFFKKYKIKEITDIIDSESFLEEVISFIGTDFVKRSPITSIFLKNNDYKVRQHLTLILLQQSLRIFGLFHDIGHLPFSHLFEFAAENISSEAKKKSNENAIKFNEVIDDILSKGLHIHEEVGKKLITFIFSSVIEQVKEDKAKTVIAILIEGILNRIRKRGDLNSIYEIISSDIDADRLDFLQRDGANSGIAVSNVNIDRILRFYTLIKHPLSGKQGDAKYKFIPAIQSLSDIEEFLMARYSIYKYMVNHHAVKRSDEIMQRIIEKIIEREVDELFWDKENGKVDIENKFNKVSGCIDVVRSVFEEDPMGPDFKTVIYSFFQITDFWLLSLLSAELRNYYGSDDEIKDLLEQVFQNSRHYSSSWKRGHEYMEFIEELGRYACKKKRKDFINPHEIIEKDLHELIGKINTLIKQLREIKSICKEGQNDLDNCNLRKTIFYDGNKCEIEDCKRKIHSEIGKVIITYLNRSDKFGGWCRNTEKNLLNRGYKTIIINTRIKSGISENGIELVNLKNKNEIIPLSKVSTVKSSIEADLAKSIKFFVYYETKKAIGKEKEMKNVVREEVFNTFAQVIKNRERDKNTKIII